VARRVLVDGVDLAPGNVELQSVRLSDFDLGQQIGTFDFVVDEEKQVTPKIPRERMEVLMYDDDGTTLLSAGFITDLELIPQPVRRRWAVHCQDYNVRAFETATGSLNKSGVTDLDRNFVIAIFRDALKAQSFGSGTGLDDPIITANEPNWPGVQGTSFLSGLDWSYMTPKNAMDNLQKYVPDVFWSIGPDKVLSYGRLRALAPFVLSDAPSGSNLKPFENYREQVIVGGHRNKMRRGGAAASEITAFDEVSYATYGRILDSPYKNDSTIPAGDLARRTYAELASVGVRRRARVRVRDKGLRAGQLVDIVSKRNGAGTKPWPFLNLTTALQGRSETGKLAGERGRFLIQRVSTVITGPSTYAFDVEAGDSVKSLPALLAPIVSS